ncbi:hypothetical protein [Lysobacter sp. CA199]|uniref:hypothetical protein n=1 Tax=Lysobacter sp. CA199 TaxID=3455608 RepID=UPI003F8D3E25
MYTLRSLSLGIGLAVSAGTVYLLSPPTPADAASRVTAAADTSSFEQVPPALDGITITSTPQSSEGNALLQLQYAKGQDLPAEIPFNVDGKPVLLKRDDKDPQLYRAGIAFDFESFVKEQEERQREAGEKDTALEFDGRLMIAEEPVRFLDPEQLRKQISAGAAIQIPRPIIFGPLRRVRPERSLMVVSPDVVEDPIRTFDACTNAGNPNGAWTFNRLMTNMANQPLTGVDPSDFVENWLRTWGTSTSVNTFPVPARTQVINQVLNTWPRLTSGKLDLARSPMRLLAIVNRVDLRTNSAYGGGSAGEGRFVFGVIRRNTNGSCTQHRFTVILEYGVPINGCPAVRSYAQQWGNLGTMVLGSPSYNSALQALTDQFTSANAAPRKPNASAINQIRTNEFLQNPWELREFNIVRGSNQLSIVPAKQTPHHSFNNSTTTSLLATFINNNQAAVLAEQHVVPLSYLGTPFLTGSSLNPSPQQAWRHPAIANNDARNKFSLNTCDACHGRETQTGSFLHVAPRSSGAQAALSQFLIGNQPGASLATPTQYTIPDAMVSSTSRNYGGDLRRRQTDLAALQNSLCRAGGVFHEAHFLPLSATH